MADYNRVIMVGNLTRDPEYKQLPSGQSVCRMGLASNRQFKSRQTGTMIQEVCFIDIDVWGAQAESCHQYLQKGRPILVEGRIKLDNWEDPEGNRRSKHSIVADRVVFLSAQASADDYQSTSTFSRPEPKSEVEQELADQLNQIKQKVQREESQPVQEVEAQPKARASKKKTAAEPQEENSNLSKGTGEIDFKDEPPFKDDLPF